MTGEGWTVETLLAHIDVQLTGLRVTMDERSAANRAALEKAETAAERRFEAVNEFRAALADQQATLMTRAEFDAQHRNLTDRLEVLSVGAVKAVTRAENDSMHDRIAERLDDHQRRLDRSEGRGVGLNAGWVYMLGVVAAVGTVVSILIAFHVGA